VIPVVRRKYGFIDRVSSRGYPFPTVFGANFDEIPRSTGSDLNSEDDELNRLEWGEADHDIDPPAPDVAV
jgi:hypothetical protein